MSEVFDSVALDYYNIQEEGADSQWVSFSLTQMTKRKMMVETRPRYPSDKLTFTIADISENKDVRFFNIELNVNEQFDVDVVLEDSQRNFLSSFILFLYLGKVSKYRVSPKKFYLLGLVFISDL